MRTALALLPAFALAAAPAAGQSLSVTVTNNQPAGGFSLTPVFLGLHDGSFDAFAVGSLASTTPGIEEIAELGDTGVMTARFDAEQPGGVSATFASGMPPVFQPGESATLTLDAAGNRFLSAASMVVPTNDLFVGVDDLVLFDDAGNFNGPITLEFFGSDVYDAGTEVNDINDGPAFVVGVDATLGTAESNPISDFFDDAGAASFLDSIVGTQTPAGEITRTFGSGDLLYTITIVPEPAAAGLLAAGGLLLARRRR